MVRSAAHPSAAGTRWVWSRRVERVEEIGDLIQGEAGALGQLDYREAGQRVGSEPLSAAAGVAGGQQTAALVVADRRDRQTEPPRQLTNGHRFHVDPQTLT